MGTDAFRHSRTRDHMSVVRIVEMLERLALQRRLKLLRMNAPFSLNPSVQSPTMPIETNWRVVAEVVLDRLGGDGP